MYYECEKQGNVVEYASRMMAIAEKCRIFLIDHKIHQHPTSIEKPKKRNGFGSDHRDDSSDDGWSLVGMVVTGYVMKRIH